MPKKSRKSTYTPEELEIRKLVLDSHAIRRKYRNDNFNNININD